METRVKKWGNSLGLRIPVQFARQLKLHAGSSVSIEIEDGRIILQFPKYDLYVMLKNIKPEILHNQKLDDEQSLGNEEW